MKIGFVAHGPIEVPVGDRHLRASSIGIWCHHVAQSMARLGARPVVYHEGGNHEHRIRAFHEYVGDVEYVGIPTGLDHRIRRAVGRVHEVGFGSRWFYPHYDARIAVDARRRGLDALVVANFSQTAPVVRRLNPSIELAVHMHCDWLVQLDRRTIDRRLHACDLVGGVTDHVSHAVAERFPHHAARCFTLANGVDLPAFDEAGRSDENLILFVGRSSPEKGLHVLIEAFEELSRGRPEARLRIVGPTQPAPRYFIVDVSQDPEVRSLGRFYESPRSYHEQLIEMVPDRLRSRVEFVGPQSSGQVVHEYGRAAIVVLPAVGPESFGMPVIEAGAASRPVVVTDVGGLPEVVEDETTGLVVPRNDAHALAKALERLLDDPELRGRMGRQGREQVVERFTWDVVARQLAEQLAR